MSAAARYLDVTPQGVAQCMTGPPRDLPQRLLRALVLRSAGQPWSSDELAGLLPGGEPETRVELELSGCPRPLAAIICSLSHGNTHIAFSAESAALVRDLLPALLTAPETDDLEDAA